MTNEKHINNWKEKLDELAVLPGEESPGMEKAWEKLEGRLRTKKRKQHYRWYWVAAAGILLFITVRLWDNTEPGTIAPAIVRTSEPTPNQENTKHPAASSEINATIINSSLHPANKIKQVSNNKSRVPVPLLPVKFKDSTQQVPLLPVETVSPVNMVNVPGSIIERPVFTSLKKKLPVVHLNELEKPIPAVEAVAGNGERPGPRIRFFNRDVSPGSPVSNNTGNNIITIKLPPLN